jgi:hypothetical protein
VAAARDHAFSVRGGRLSPSLRILAPLALALLLIGCGAPRDEQGPPRTRTSRTLTPAERDSAALAGQDAGTRKDSVLAAHTRAVLADWEEAWARVIPGFQLDSLRWQKRDTLQPQTAALGSTALDSLTQRRWKLMFTSDRWIAVDPEFGRTFAPGGRYEGRGAPQVTVYDFRARQSLVLDQNSSEGRPYAVTGWLGERRLVVAGWTPWAGAVKTLRPAVWIYDLDSLHRTTGMGPPVSEPELQAHEAMLELLIRMRNAPARRR